MKKYDIIVVGAGTGGTTAARFASKAGFDVCLIDAKPREKIGDKMTGEDKRFLDEEIKNFQRSGILLSEAKRNLLKKLNQRIAILSLEYSKNIREDWRPGRHRGCAQQYWHRAVRPGRIRKRARKHAKVHGDQGEDWRPARNRHYTP